MQFARAFPGNVRGWGGAAASHLAAFSPPPVHNFDETPVVTHEAYDYASLMAEEVEIG